MSDFERCSELRDWRLAHAGDLPRRRSDDAYEQSLALWFSKALQRQQRALSSRPSHRQLTLDETAHLDSIVRMAIEAPAAVPIEPLRKRRRTKSKPASTSPTPEVNSHGLCLRDVEEDGVVGSAGVSGGASASNASSSGLRCEGSGPNLAQSLCLRGLNIQYPFSQLILEGLKVKEARTYELGKRNIAHPGEELFLIETPGSRNTVGALVEGMPQDKQACRIDFYLFRTNFH
jgi:hypothetical protein